MTLTDSFVNNTVLQPMLQITDGHRDTASQSAFEKWSGHVMPKCCRKGGGGWAMTLKGKEY